MAQTRQKSAANGRKSASSKRGAQARAQTPAGDGPATLTQAHLSGFAAGILAGLLMGSGGALWLMNNPEELPAALDEAADALSADTRSKPRFQFYTLLPNEELDLASDVEASAERDAQRSDLYVLQAGSFRINADADRRRGELLLLGFDATIEETSSDNGVWFRVYIGPFESRTEMARARSVTAQESIDTLLLRRPRS